MVFQPAEWKSNAHAFREWVDRTARAAQDTVRAAAESNRNQVEDHKQQVKSRREEAIQQLASEVAQSETARNLVNLLI